MTNISLTLYFLAKYERVYLAGFSSLRAFISAICSSDNFANSGFAPAADFPVVPVVAVLRAGGRSGWERGVEVVLEETDAGEGCADERIEVVGPAVGRRMKSEPSLRGVASCSDWTLWRRR